MSEENNTFENDNQQVNEDTTYANVNGEVPQKGQSTGLGIASMVCGILSIVTICCVPYVPVILGIVAVVLGIVQIVKNEKKGMAIAGIVCGALGLIAYIALFAFGTYLLSSGMYDDLMKQYNIPTA